MTGPEIDCGYQDIQVADGRTHAAQRTSRGSLHHPRDPLERSDNLLNQRVSLAEGETTGTAAERFDPSQDLVLGFLAHAGQGADFAGAGGSFKLGQRGNPEFFPDQSDLFGTHPGHLQPVGEAGRNLALQLFQEFELPGAQQLVDLLGDSLADARDFGEFAFLPDLVDIPAQI